MKKLTPKQTVAAVLIGGTLIIGPFAGGGEEPQAPAPDTTATQEATAAPEAPAEPTATVIEDEFTIGWLTAPVLQAQSTTVTDPLILGEGVALTQIDGEEVHVVVIKEELPEGEIVTGAWLASPDSQEVTAINTDAALLTPTAPVKDVSADHIGVTAATAAAEVAAQGME